MTDRMQDQAPRRSMARTLLNGLRLRRRLLVAIAAALIVALIVPASFGASVRSALVWNTGGLIYLASAFALMSTCGTDGIKLLASHEDEARFAFFALILFAVLSSFYAVFALIGDAKALSGSAKLAHIALAALTIFVSWMVMQVVFTLHYAHEFYATRRRAGDIARGMTFPGDDAPDYWDFFYFTTSIGATSQTSDVAITSKGVRRMVAFQAVLAFAYNTTIVALAINLASGLV